MSTELRSDLSSSVLLWITSCFSCTDSLPHDSLPHDSLPHDLSPLHKHSTNHIIKHKWEKDEARITAPGGTGCNVMIWDNPDEEQLFCFCTGQRERVLMKSQIQRNPEISQNPHHRTSDLIRLRSLMLYAIFTQSSHGSHASSWGPGVTSHRE